MGAIHRRDAQVSLKDVQLITLDLDTGGMRFVWSVSVGDGASGSLYQADLDGSHVRKPGVDGTDPKAAIAKADMIVRCLARAGRDVAKIQACSR